MDRTVHKPDKLHMKQITQNDPSTTKTKLHRKQAESKSSSKSKHKKKLTLSDIPHFKQKLKKQFRSYYITPMENSSMNPVNLSDDYCINQYFAKNSKLQTHTSTTNNKSKGKKLQNNRQTKQQDSRNLHIKKTNPQGITKMCNKDYGVQLFHTKKVSPKIKFTTLPSEQKKQISNQTNRFENLRHFSFKNPKSSRNQSQVNSKSKSKKKSNSKQIKLNQNQLKKKETQLFKQKKSQIHLIQKFIKSKSHNKLQLSTENDKMRQKPQCRSNMEKTLPATMKSQKIIKTNNQNQQISEFQQLTQATAVTNQPDQQAMQSFYDLRLKQYYFKYQHPLNTKFQEIAHQVNAEIQNFITFKNDKNFKNSFLQRLKCLHLIASIFGHLGVKRQTFFLTVLYFDKYVLNFECQNIKRAALASVMIALKMDFAQMLPKYIGSFKSNSEVTVKKAVKGHKKSKNKLSSSFFPKQKSQNKQAEDELMQIIERPIFTSSRSRYLCHRQQEFNIGEIIEEQVEIINKLKFKFHCSSFGYWADLMSFMWDQYLLNEEINTSPSVHHLKNKKILFKTTPHGQPIKDHHDFKLLSYLFQTCESILISIETYKYPPVILILSIIYLLIRLHIQQTNSKQPFSVYKSYRENLSKSCNLIFCDSTGVNEIFGNFLSKLNLNMVMIVETVQFVSGFVCPEKWNVWNYNQQPGESYADRLSCFLYNQNTFLIKEEQPVATEQAISNKRQRQEK